MSWLSKPTDLPLADDASARFLTWITALMCLLATLALAGALAAASVAARWSAGLGGDVTVEIAAMTDQHDVPPQAARVETALALLRTFPGVTGAHPLAASETTRLLEPWLGAEVAEADLPVPVLIDVIVGPTLDLAALQGQLASVPGATLDDHGEWLSDVRLLTHAIEIAAAFVLLVVGTAGLAAVAFAVTTGLSVHHDLVRLLHLMGATDAYVARQFERHVLRRSLIGALIGWAGAVAVVVAGDQAAPLIAGAVISLQPNGWQWAVLPIVPIATSGLAVLIARTTVLRTLAAMP